MAARIAIPRRRHSPELLDMPHGVANDLAANLADIRFLNRWFGGTSLALAAVRELAADRCHLSIVDVATGSADIPLALLRRARREGKSIEIMALDSSPEILAVAADVTAGSSIQLTEGDARALPWHDNAFDIATCCLALHHFEPQEAVTVLREMWRVCRVGIVVTDLVRGYLAYAGTWLVTRTLAHNRVTRHDGPLSVLRAYTPAELRSLAEAADIPAAVVRRRPLFRQMLVASRREIEDARVP